MFESWDNDSDYARNEVGDCEVCGQEFDMWNRWGILYKRCPLCRRQDRWAKEEGLPIAKPQAPKGTP